MDLVKIEELIQALESSQASELAVKAGDSRVKIRRGEPTSRPAYAPTAQLRVDQKLADQPPHGEALVRAPMVGLFRASDSLTEVGARVSAGQVVGSIESMKLLNDIVSDVSGDVIESMVEDGTPVEYNQILCKIKILSKIERP
jgi:acetyl-CoA carboxylase biotin carboxyl carrier protein